MPLLETQKQLFAANRVVILANELYSVPSLFFQWLGYIENVFLKQDIPRVVHCLCIFRNILKTNLSDVRVP